MKSHSRLIVGALAAMLMPLTVNAQQVVHDIQICTGGTDGNYAKVGHMIQAQLRQIDPKKPAQIVNTQGSVQNLRLMMNPRGDKDGWCDVAIVQKDALANFERENGGAKDAISRLMPLYPEKVHFLFNRAAADRLGIKRVPDIRNKDVTIAVGTAGSGNNETWKALTGADKSYEKIGKSFERADRALVKVADGETIQGMVVTSGLKTPFMNDVLTNYGDRIVLLGFDDGDLTKIKDAKGQHVYKLTAIPAGMYRAIQPSGIGCWGSCEVNTAEVYSNRWEEQAGDGFRHLTAAVNNIRTDARKLNDPK